MSTLRREGILFCLVGAAASGKTTFGQRLLDDFASTMQKSISVTSRAPRAGEVAGVSYHFVTRTEFENKISASEFFEWEETHGNLYGTLEAPLKQAIATGNDVLLDVDIRGSQTFKKRYHTNTVVTFVVPPSVDVLRERLFKRGSLSPGEIERRLKTASSEYELLGRLAQDAGAIDYIVVNDDLERSYSIVRSIVVSERVRLSRLNRSDLAKICVV